MHGLETRLPIYMERKRAAYGALLVLRFKGPWFDRPTLADIRRVDLSTALDEHHGDLKDLMFALTSRATHGSVRGRIRVFIVDVSKPVAASKA